VKSKYIHNVYDNPDLKSLVVNESQGWELSELFKRFYLLIYMAEYYHQGGCNLTTVTSGDCANNVTKNKARWIELNTVEVPAVMTAILRMLSPDKDINITIPRLTDEA